MDIFSHLPHVLPLFPVLFLFRSKEKRQVAHEEEDLRFATAATEKFMATGFHGTLGTIAKQMSYLNKYIGDDAELLQNSFMHGLQLHIINNIHHTRKMFGSMPAELLSEKYAQKYVELMDNAMRMGVDQKLAFAYASNAWRYDHNMLRDAIVVEAHLTDVYERDISMREAAPRVVGYLMEHSPRQEHLVDAVLDYRRRGMPSNMPRPADPIIWRDHDEPTEREKPTEKAPSKKEAKKPAVKELPPPKPLEGEIILPEKKKQIEKKQKTPIIIDHE